MDSKKKTNKSAIDQYKKDSLVCIRSCSIDSTTTQKKRVIIQGTHIIVLILYIYNPLKYKFKRKTRLILSSYPEKYMTVAW